MTPARKAGIGGADPGIIRVAGWVSFLTQPVGLPRRRLWTCWLPQNDGLYCAYWLNPAIVTESWNFKTASPSTLPSALLSSGMSIDEVLRDYEDLEREDILATLAFAARLAQVKRIQPLAA